MDKEVTKDDEDLTEEELDIKYGEPANEPEESTESPEESPDTDTETAAKDESSDAPDTETETAEESTETEVDPGLALLKSLGLDGQFSSTEDALKSISPKDLELGRLRREQADRGRETTPDPSPQTASDNKEALRQQWQDDPEGVFLRVVDALDQTQKTVNNIQAEHSLTKAIVVNPDIESRRQEIDEIISGDPVLRYANSVNPGWAATQALYAVLAKNGTPAPPEPKKVKVAAVSQDAKANAVTTTGKGSPPKRKSAERTTADYEAMSEEEMDRDPVIGIRED